MDIIISVNKFCMEICPYTIDPTTPDTVDLSLDDGAVAAIFL